MQKKSEFFVSLLKGLRYDIHKKAFDSEVKIEASRDSFTGVNPIYVLDTKNKKEILSIWGSTVYEGMTKEQVEKIAPTEAKTLPVIIINKFPIVAIETGYQSIWVHSLYPKLGYGIFTQVGYSFLGDSAKGAVYQSKCSFGGLMQK